LPEVASSAIKLRNVPFLEAGMKFSLKVALRIMLIAVLGMCGTSAFAQFNASLSGTVQDNTQAAIPSATVTLTNNDTQAMHTVHSGDAGTYHFSELPPGSYTLTVVATGFQQNTINNIVIAAETPRGLNVTLTPGAATETVNVNGDTEPLLQTTDANIGTSLTNEEITRLPIVGSDPYELLRTAPGITGNGARSGSGNAVFLPNGAGPGGSNSSVFQTENQVQIIADGQRVGDNNYMVDGVSVNSLTHAGSAVVTPNEESVGSLSVVATSYDATQARFTGAQIETVTKSGTNHLHGSAFFLYDNPGFNSFNSYGTGPGTPAVRNQNANRNWAGSLGGPVIKDKLFFFLSYQEFKDKNPSFQSEYVLTSQFRAALAANRAGGVTTATLAQPSSNPIITAILAPSCTGLTVGVNCNVVGGGLDLGSLTPGGASQLGVFPGTNTGGGLDNIPDVDYAQVELPQQARGNQYNYRVDYQLSPKDLIASSAYFSKLSTVSVTGTSPGALQASTIFKPLNSSATLIYVHTFSPSWLNEARVNYTRFADNALKDGGNAVNYGIPYDNVQNYPFSLQFGVQASTTTPANFAENTYNFRDLVTHTFGSNTVRFGGTVLWEQDNDNLYGYDRPTYAFNGLFAFANDASVYESIYANPTTGLPATLQRYYRSQEVDGFFQDDWKATKNLTINAGLRYNYFSPWHNKGFEVNQPVLGPGPTSQLSGLTLQLKNNFWPAQYGNFGPHFGFAYTPPVLNNKIVVRGGYALAYNDLDAALVNVSAEDGPGVANFGLCCGANGNTAGIIYALGSSNSPLSYPYNPALKVGVNAAGFPNGIGAEVYGAAPNIKYPSSDLYSLEMEGDLGHGMTATVGYQGASGRHFARFVLQNFLYNQNGSPGPVYFLQTDSVANYNALTVQLRRPMRNHIAYSFVYTYGKALDQVSNGDGADGAANQTNPANNASEYGPADYDMKHHVVATGLYQTPTIHTGSHILTALISGYQVNGTYTFNTGLPYTPVVGTYNSIPFMNGAATQNIVRPQAYYGGANSSCSTSAFESRGGSNFPNTTPVAGQQSAYFETTLPNGATYVPGIGRNSFRSSCYQDVDMSFAKEFALQALHHNTLLRFQANVFNIFNENEAAPIGNDNNHNNVTNANFGLSPAGDAGRVIELEGRFQF
jgi:hypothetical protein